MSGIDKALDYMKMIYGEHVLISEFRDLDKLPLYLKTNYKYFVFTVFGSEFLGVEVNDKKGGFSEIISLKNGIRRYVKSIENVLVIFEYENEYVRRECIKKRISFVLPGKEMFFPEIGILYSEYLKKNAYKINGDKKVEKISMVAQALLFAIDSSSSEMNQKEYAKKLGYSEMSISRAINELSNLEIIEKAASNCYVMKKSLISVIEDQIECLSNPVQSVAYVENAFDGFDDHDMCLAGESELSYISMMGEPKNRVIAMYKNKWKKYKEKVSYVPSNRDKCIVVQSWKHPVPRLNGRIHPLALFLSLKDEYDERVQGELEEVLEEYRNGKWD